MAAALKTCFLEISNPDLTTKALSEVLGNRLLQFSIRVFSIECGLSLALSCTVRAVHMGGWLIRQAKLVKLTSPKTRQFVDSDPQEHQTNRFFRRNLVDTMPAFRSNVV